MSSVVSTTLLRTQSDARLSRLAAQGQERAFEAIVERYRDLAGEDLPIRVVCTPDQAARFADLLAGVEVWEHDPTVADLDGFAAEVEAVDRAR